MEKLRLNKIMADLIGIIYYFIQSLYLIIWILFANKNNIKEMIIISFIIWLIGNFISQSMNIVIVKYLRKRLKPTLNDYVFIKSRLVKILLLYLDFIEVNFIINIFSQEKLENNDEMYDYDEYCDFVNRLNKIKLKYVFFTFEFKIEKNKEISN